MKRSRNSAYAVLTEICGGVPALLQEAVPLSQIQEEAVRDSARLDNGPGTFEFEGKRVR